MRTGLPVCHRDCITSVSVNASLRVYTCMHVSMVTYIRVVWTVCPSPACRVEFDAALLTCGKVISRGLVAVNGVRLDLGRFPDSSNLGGCAKACGFTVATASCQTHIQRPWGARCCASGARGCNFSTLFDLLAEPRLTQLVLARMPVLIMVRKRSITRVLEAAPPS